MKTLKTFLHCRNDGPGCQPAKGCLAAMLVIFAGLSSGVVISRAQPAGNDVQGVQVLTRGPVHEAFAGIVTFNPEPGVVVTKTPPNVIEELPPAERPEGDNVTWIPGYWAWDDERSDFLWISGTWRALPPGREWMAGYWAPTTQGHQWISGYWADASVRDTSYLPAPPATVEVGPNIAAPSIDYGWTPGCWIWYQGRYAWSPGYWAQGRADWVWIPAHYVWTPRGYIFVGGFWDYPVERRGMLFAPIYFESAVYSRRGYIYSPAIVINLAMFSDHLFLRPSYQHYYFGDYYATSYSQRGYYASYTFQSSRYGYDPFYSHQRWEHRQDREWEHRVQVSYQYRRDNETARPPRTWVAQRSFTPGPTASAESRVVVATPIEQLTQRKDSPTRFQTVARDERQKLAQRGREVQQSRDQRRTLESKVEATVAQKPGVILEPAKVQLPRSPIVARPVNQMGRNQSPPTAPQAPQPDLKVQPRSDSPRRQPEVERNNPQPEPRKVESERNPAPGRSEAAPRERRVQPESQQRANEAAAKAQEESQRNARGLEQKAQQESERRAKQAAVKSVEDSQRNAQGMEKKSQQEAEQRARESVVKAQEETQRNARALEQKAQQESEHRANDPAAKAKGNSQRNAPGLAKKAQPEPEQRAKASEQPAKEPPAAAEKGAAKPVKKGQEDDEKDKEKPSPRENPREP